MKLLHFVRSRTLCVSSLLATVQNGPVLYINTWFSEHSQQSKTMFIPDFSQLLNSSFAVTVMHIVNLTHPMCTLTIQQTETYPVATCENVHCILTIYTKMPLEKRTKFFARTAWTRCVVENWQVNGRQATRNIFVTRHAWRVAMSSFGLTMVWVVFIVGCRFWKRMLENLRTKNSRTGIVLKNSCCSKIDDFWNHNLILTLSLTFLRYLSPEFESVYVHARLINYYL